MECTKNGVSGVEDNSSGISSYFFCDRNVIVLSGLTGMIGSVVEENGFDGRMVEYVNYIASIGIGIEGDNFVGIVSAGEKVR